MTLLPLLTQWLLAAVFGGMLIFSLLFAPLVFTQLDAETAGRFIRRVFPWYYGWVMALGSAALLGLWLNDGTPLQLGLAAAIALGALLSRWPLMARINALRDRQLRGDAAAGRRFDRLHRLSVAINVAQLLAAAALIGLVTGSL